MTSLIFKTSGVGDQTAFFSLAAEIMLSRIIINEMHLKYKEKCHQNKTICLEYPYVDTRCLHENTPLTGCLFRNAPC
jgi:hypothetical protein